MDTHLRPYRSAERIISDIERLLADNQPCFHSSPLEQVVEILTQGRRYSWVGIYLSLDKRASSPLLESAHPAHLAVPGTVKKIVISIRIAGRELGSLSVESDRENSFGAEDRVLLEHVAGQLARFLTSRGKYLVRRAAHSAPVSPLKAAAA